MSKSISIFHASLGENARLARQAGDAAGDRYWTALVTEVDDMIWHAVEAGFGYFQREAGYTRTGSHNTRVHGRETGQWHEADLAVAHWLQHTSRDGDMQLHVHSQIAHIARTGTDGKWRAPDSLGYNEHVGAVAAIVSQHLEEALTRRFGVDWVARDDGHGFEIKGIGGEIMRVFSSRRVAITADLRARAARFEQRYGRKPSQRELAQLAQASNFKTRAAKEGALDFAELHQGWADKLARTLGVRLASVAPSVWHDGGDATARTRDPDGPGHTQLELVQAAQKAVALAQQEKSTWTRADLIKYLGRVLPRSGMDPETAAAREQRYRNLLMAHLPPGYRREPGHQVRWLWRTLRAAELAGLDAGGVLAAAIGERDLAGARDIPAVIDTRLRHRTGNLVPLPAGPWSAQIPAITDPERRAYAAEIAALMDARKDRIGEHAADHALPWAVNALGPVPAHPVDRLEWHRRASSLGAWRELSGYDHPADPIGPEPAAAAPDLRAAWHEALAALGPADGPDVRGMPDGTLLHLRDTYPLETAWAPQYVGDELRQVRAAACHARLAGVRAAAEALAAQRRGQHEQASQQQTLAASYQALHDIYAERESVFAAVMTDRADWDAATRAQRHLAVAADAELRRRHPGRQYPPLRSAEPPPPTPAQRHELTLTTGDQIQDTGQWIKDLAAQHRTFAQRLAERQSLTIPSADPGYGDLGQAFPPWPAPAAGAILQPPKPEIPPSEQILEHITDRAADWEAAD